MVTTWVAVLAAALHATPSTIIADTLRGRVTDSAGAPLADVTISLPQLARATRSNSDGTFLLGDVPAGRSTLVLTRPGFAPAMIDTVVAGTTAVTVALRATPFALDALTVTATRSPLPPLGSPLPTAALSGDRLQQRPAVSLAQAIDGLPGVRAVTTGGEIGKPMIRGLDGARVLVLDDGRRLEDYSWSDEDGPSADARFADRVEVIRGPASVLYGSDALGGVVNIIPEDLPFARPGVASARADVSIYGASNNGELGAVAKIEGTGGNLGWRGQLAGRHAEALHTPAGELENTGFGSLNGEIALGTHARWGTAALRVVHYGGEFHLLEAGDTVPPLPPKPSLPPGQQDEGPVRKLADDRVQSSGTVALGPGASFEAKAQYERHSLAEVVEGANNGGEPGFDLLLRTATLDLLLHHNGSGLRGTVGVSGVDQHNATRGQEPLVPGAYATGIAAFAFEETSVGRWSFLAGARGDRRHLAVDSNAALAQGPDTRVYTAWSGDGGVVYRLAPEVALAANAGRAWRAPTLFELFANGPHIGEARFEKGSAGLVPEASLNLDSSLRWQGHRSRGELAVYRNTINHYIYITPTAGTQDSLPVYQYMQADAVLTGLEASLDIQPWTPITVRGRIDAVRGWRRDSGAPLPLMPPLRSTLGIEWQERTLTGEEREKVGVELEAVARQTRLDSLDIPTAGYRLVHLHASVQRPLGGDSGGRVGRRTLRIDLQIRNVANTRYRDFLSRYKGFALNPGRNIILGVSTEF